MKSIEFYNEIDCTHCSFLPICSSTKDLPQIKSVVEKQIHVKKGDKICRADQKFYNYYIVYSGLIKSYSIRVNSKEHISNFYFKGDIIGFDALYKMKFEFEIDAMTDAQVCVIPSHFVANIISYKPELQRYILQLVSKQINSKSYLTYLNADQRLAGYLLEMIRRLKITEKLIKLPMSQIDIANHLTLTPETVNRTFRRWQANGIITNMRNKQFSLPDINNLTQICW